LRRGNAAREVSDFSPGMVSRQVELEMCSRASSVERARERFIFSMTDLLGAEIVIR